MSIIALSVKRPVAVSMFLLLLMILGVFASIRLPVDFLPSIESPILTVSVSYSGAGPEAIESAITRPLESVFSTLDNVEKIQSTSREGSSSIRIEYSWGTDLDDAMFKLRESIDTIRDQLPTKSKSPRISKFSTDASPVLGFFLVGIDDQATAYDFASHVIKKRLEAISGVGQVDISGGLQTEIHIELYQNRLQAYQLNAEQVASIVANNNVSMAGGYLFQGTYKFGVRTDGEIKDLEGFRNIVVTYRNNVPIFLKDLANIYYGSNEDNGSTYVAASNIQDESSKLAGRSSVIIEVIKTSEANAIEVEKEIQKFFKELRKTLPSNVSIVELYNNAADIQRSLKGLMDTALQGGLFALLIIFFYLWEWRSVLVIALTIPCSIITTFIAMYFFGVSFNTISLAGLTLAIGMMVDSSIVVLENIFRHKQEGYGKYNASILGTEEVVLAITASTFTTIAVFAPILFLEGMAAQMFRDLVITVVCGLLASLIISITLIPMLCSLLIKEVPMTSTPNEKVLQNIDTIYAKLLKTSLKYKKKIAISSLLIVIVGSWCFLKYMKKENIPASDEGRITINLTFPLGTRYEENNRISREMLKEIKNQLGKSVQYISLQVKLNFVRSGAVLEHRSRFRVNLVPRNERKEDINAIVRKLRPILAQYPVKIALSTTGGRHTSGSGGESVAMEIQGNDLDQSQIISEKIVTLLQNMPDVINPRNTAEDILTEIVLTPDRVAVSRAGLNPRTLFNIVQTSFGGRNASQVMNTIGDYIDVRVRIREEDRASFDSLLQFAVSITSNKTVPLSTLVDIKSSLGPREIKRSDSIRKIDLRASLTGKYQKDIVGAVNDIAENIKQNIFLPPGVRVVFKGDYEETQKSMRSMFMAFLLAVFVVYALMSSLFESYIAPLVIMICVPFGVFGSLLFLQVFNHSLNTYSTVGMVILVGIVINNGIVLVDYMNKLLERGYSIDDAALLAGTRRIRPVCMTTFTTILGMIPMSLGLSESGEIYAPLAVSVIGGLLVSTLFTLFIVPILYAGIRQRFPYRFYNKINIIEETQDEKIFRS